MTDIKFMAAVTSSYDQHQAMRSVKQLSTLVHAYSCSALCSAMFGDVLVIMQLNHIQGMGCTPSYALLGHSMIIDNTCAGHAV
jgi:hypothetical protein